MPVYGMVRLPQEQFADRQFWIRDKTREQRLYALDVQEASGRLVLTFGAPGSQARGPQLSLTDSELDFSTLETGQKLTGVVVGMTAQAAWIDCRVRRKGRGGRYVALNGRLAASCLPSHMALAKQTVFRCL